MRKTIWATMLAALTMAGIVLVPSAAQAEAPNCRIFANNPVLDWNDGKLIGIGGRVDCTSTVTFRVRMREDINNWPDRTLQERWLTAANGTIELWHPCNPFLGPMKVFVETLVEGGPKYSSAHIVMPCHD